MAPLTWRNVDAPDFDSASRILDRAVSSWGNAFGGASDALLAARQRQKSNRSSAAIPILARVADAAGVDPAINQVTGSIATQDMTPELQEALLGLRDKGLGYDQTNALIDASKASTAATRATSARAEAKHRADMEAQEALAALTPGLVRAREEAAFGRDPGQVAAETGPVANAGALAGLPLLPSPSERSQDPNGVYIGADGLPRINGRISVADMVQPGSRVNVDDLLKIVTDNFDTGTKAETERDENRNRDAEFQRREDAVALAQAAQDNALAFVGNTYSVDEALRAAANSDLPNAEKLATMEAIRGLPADAMQSADPNAVGAPAGTGAASIASQQYVADQEAALADNAGVRVNRNAESVYSDGDPAIKLMDRMGSTDATPAQTVTAINRVAGELNISPARAAALLEETAKANNRFLPGDQKVKWDVSAAVSLGEQLLSPEGRRAAVEVAALGQANIQSAQNLQAAIADLTQRRGVAATRNNQAEVTRLDKEIASRVNQLLSLAQNAPVVGRTPSRDPEATEPLPEPTSQPAQTAQDITEQARSGSGQAAEVLQIQAENAARDLIADMFPNIPVESIAAMNTGQLQDALANMANMAMGTPEEAAILAEINAVEEALNVVSRNDGTPPPLKGPSADLPPLQGPSADPRDSVSYEQWLNMSRSERRRRGLPISAIGGEIAYRNRKN
jgi:hypothetical protein